MPSCIGEQFPHVAEPRLNFVHHHKHAVLAANLRGITQEAVGRNDDARFTLNGFNEKRAGVGSDGLAQSLGIAEGNAPERAESVGIGLIAGKTYDGNGASVKIVGAR